MRHDPEHAKEQAERGRRWAISIPDPIDRQRIEAVVRDYEEMARAAERGEAAKLPC